MKASNIAFPFHRISDSDIIPGTWELRINNGDWREAGGSIEAWDYQTLIEARREFEIMSPAILERMQFGTHPPPLKIAILMTTGMPPFRKTVWASEPIGWNETCHVEAKFDINSWTLSGLIKLQTDIVLAGKGSGTGSLAPYMAGSRLWEDEISIQIEGTGSRFPIELASFAQKFHGLGIDNAPWYICWSGNSLEDNFLGSVVLFLNSDRGEILEGLRCKNPIIMGELRAAIVRQLSTKMLELIEEDEDPEEMADDCVGKIVSQWLAILPRWKGLDQIQRVLNEDRTLFEAKVHSAFGHLSGGGPNI